MNARNSAREAARTYDQEGERKEVLWGTGLFFQKQQVIGLYISLGKNDQE